jgi:hypothetical protein
MLSTSITVTDCDGSSVDKNASDEYIIKDSGITTAKFADGAITGPKMSSVNVVVSSSSGNYNSNDMTSSWNNVTNLSVTITSTGRPIHILMISDGSGSPSKIEGYAGGGFISLIRFLRGGSEVFISQIEGSGGGASTYESGDCQLFHLEAIAAGTYTYSVQVKSLSNTNTWVKYFKLVAYELP